MPKFTIIAHETTELTYEIEAPTLAEAREIWAHGENCPEPTEEQPLGGAGFARAILPDGTEILEDPEPKRPAGMLLRITPEQIEALGYILDLAHGDQEHWLNAGNSSVDYGDDWPRVANMKAAQFRAVAQVAGVLIAGERERWEALAGAMVLDAIETSIPDGGE